MLTLFKEINQKERNKSATTNKMEIREGCDGANECKKESVTAKLLKPSELWEFAKIYEWQKIFDIFEIISESKQSP